MKPLVAAFFALLVAAVPTAAQMPPIVAVAPGQMLQGRFTQERHLVGIAAPLRSEGTFALIPGQGLIWRNEKPFKTTTVITAAGILQVVDGNPSLNLQTARLPFLKPFYDMLSGALAGDWAAMNRAFIATREGDVAPWHVRLVPAASTDPANAAISSVLLGGAKFVETVEIRRPSGDWEILAFLDQALSPAAIAPEDARLFAMVGK